MAISSSRDVEKRSLKILEPYLNEISNERFVLTQGSALAKDLQATVGDVLINRNGVLETIELKAEEEWTGNLFLETWSNMNLESEADWLTRGSNPGWAWKIYPNYLFYHFLDNDTLYVFRAYGLWCWMHKRNSMKSVGGSRIHDFKKVCQGKNEQMNDTWGHLVPIQILEKEHVSFKLVHPKKMFETEPEPVERLNEF